MATNSCGSISRLKDFRARDSTTSVRKTLETDFISITSTPCRLSNGIVLPLSIPEPHLGCIVEIAPARNDELLSRRGARENLHFADTHRTQTCRAPVCHC